MSQIILDRKTPSSILCVGLGWFPNSPGGSTRYVYELTHHLASGGDRVELCEVGLPEEAELNSPVQLTNLCEPDWSIWRRFHSVRNRFLERQIAQPDAINLHFPLYSLPLLSILPDDVPVTFTFHGPWAAESQQEGENKLNVLSKYWLEKMVYRSCGRFIVLSKAFGKILHQQYHVSEDKIHVVPGGVDIQHFEQNLSRQQARAQLDWPQDRLILFTPRRLVHRMGIDRLLQAVAQVKTMTSDVWLAVAGKGYLKTSLEQQAQELDISDCIKFLGYVPDEQLPIAYQAADLTVIPSQALEGFGLVLLESLACGTPVLCTPVGGMPEVLESFSPELITESTEVKAIAMKLASLLQGELSLPSRTACREYAVTNYNWSNIAQQVRQIFLI